MSRINRKSKFTNFNKLLFSFRVNCVTNGDGGESRCVEDVCDARVLRCIPQVLLRVVDALHELLATGHDHDCSVSAREIAKSVHAMFCLTDYLSKFFSLIFSMMSSVTDRHEATVMRESNRSICEKCSSMATFKIASTSSRLNGLLDSSRYEFWKRSCCRPFAMPQQLHMRLRSSTINHQLTHKIKSFRFCVTKFMQSHNSVTIVTL